MAKTPTEIRSLARKHTAKALKTLAAIMNEPSAPHAARVAASNSLLDRGWGKPAQAIIGGEEEDNPVRLVHRIVREIVPANPAEAGDETQ